MIAAHPVMASETLSANSLPAAGVSVQPAASLGDSTRVGALRKGSRVSEAEGFIPASLLANPLVIISGVVFTAGILDGLNIIDFEVINFGFLGIQGPYGTNA